MRDRWVGVEAGVDALRWARLLRQAHEQSLVGGQVPAIVRDVIAASWKRCTAEGVDPDQPGAPLTIDPVDAGKRWREHPLSRAADVLERVLGDLLYDARHIVVVSDADGCLLWSDGHPDVLRASERIHFSPGHVWSERAAGTNAVGTAIAAGHAVQVFSAEHFRFAVHGWQCSCAPIHDPETGRMLGAVDVTGDYRTAHPHSLALVRTAARLTEEQLRREMYERDARILSAYADHAARRGGPAAALAPSGRVLASTPPGWVKGHVGAPSDNDRVDLPDGAVVQLQPLGEGFLALPERAVLDARRRSRPTLSLLGRPQASYTSGGAERQLSARHSEIVALLALHPEGLSSKRLGELLYGAPGHQVSARAEVHRLREILGPALSRRPYRLTDVDVDIVTVQKSIRRGSLAAAAVAYPGPLLPGSSLAPIVRARKQLQRSLGRVRPLG